MTADPLQFVEQALTLIAPFVLLYVAIMLALRYQAVGMLLALVGVGGIVWGSWYLMGALSPENRSNDLKDIAVAFGIAAILTGGLLMVTGVWTGTIAAKRGNALAPPQNIVREGLCRAGGCSVSGAASGLAGNVRICR